MKKILFAVALTVVGLSAPALDTTTNNAFWDTRNYRNNPVTVEQTSAPKTFTVDTWVKDVVTSTIPSWFSSFKRGLILMFR